MKEGMVGWFVGWLVGWLVDDCWFGQDINKLKMMSEWEKTTR